MGAAALAPTAISDPTAERPLWQGTPSAKCLLGAIVGGTLFALAVTIGVVLLYGPAVRLVSGISPGIADFLAQNERGLRLAAVLFVLTVVGLRLARLGWRVAVLKSHRYRVTNQRIIIESGVLSKQIDEIDMRTVDDLEFRQGVIERLLGIGGITIISSDKSTTRVRLLGLEKPRELRELIRTSAYQATRGQLFTRQT